MKPDLIHAHTSFLGHTGYANHSREFFTALNKHTATRVRNYTHIDDLSYLTEEQYNMLIHQVWDGPPYEVGKPFDRSKFSNVLNIVLNETHHYFFYDKYEGPKIAYNVWESTRQPEEYFNKILEYDQFWVPTEWQKIVTAEQGYPIEKIKVVPEGIDPSIFRPNPRKRTFDPQPYRFVVVGRWEHRKSTTEIISAFINEFKEKDEAELPDAGHRCVCR